MLATWARVTRCQVARRRRAPATPPALAALCDAFHDVHDRTFGYAYRGQQEVEIVNLRVEAVGRVSRPALQRRGVRLGRTRKASP